MSNSNTEIYKHLTVGVVVGAAIAIGLLVLWSGYALTMVWGWMMVPIYAFHPLDTKEALVAAVIALSAYSLARPGVVMLLVWVLSKFQPPPGG